MPELRKGPVIGRWVIISTEWGHKPSDFTTRVEPKQSEASCPFCAGREGATPPEVLAHRPGGPANSPGWTVRVVPNKFPALMVEGDLARRGEGLYDRMNGVGAHEVIIETPEHVPDFADLP